MVLTHFKLLIKSAIFREDRWILFDIQEYEQLEQGEIKLETADALDGRWQQAIDEYWRRCEIALDWSRRAKKVQQDKARVKEMGMAINIEHVRLPMEGPTSTLETT